MNPTRRTFFRKFAGIAGTLSISTTLARAAAEDVSDALLNLKKLSPAEAAMEEEIWNSIRQAYTVSANIINLNNGGVSPQPKVVQDAVDRYYHLSNEAPSYYMWRILDMGREPVREKLAHLADCSPEEVAVDRNATEALDTAIFGMRLEKGDEVILTKQDYPNMINAWKQREMRDGIVLKWLNLELPENNEDKLVNAYTSAFTSKTKVVHITQMINWNGQIIPAKRIVAEARKRNIISIVDGAHTFAHFYFSLSEMAPDYFGTSLHKWLCAPFGTGMMYVRKENIADTWPLFPNHEPLSDNIRKFEGLGTRSFAPEQAIGQALDFHNAIGSKRKEERLRFLKNYWCKNVMDIDRVKLNISLEPHASCALGNFSIDGIDPGDIANKLFSDYKIHTVGIKWENINGVRVTPHVYTNLYDLDKLVDAIHTISKS
jgi:selenocysteine lyase/cysteine desulfurase